MDVNHTHVQKNSLISTKTIGICIAVVAVAFLAVTIFRLPVSTVVFAGILLACPLLHVLMMKGGGHNH